MDRLISLVRGIISCCICVSKHHIIHLKYVQCLFVNEVERSVHLTACKFYLKKKSSEIKSNPGT